MSKGNATQPAGTADIEFSRPLTLARLNDRGLGQHLEANATERDAVARRLGLVALDRLEADLTVRAEAGGKLVEVEGDLAAKVTQKCVVTLEPVESELHDHFLQLYTTDPTFAQSDEIVVDVEEQETPEPIEKDAVDLGEAVVQQLALTLDPYPRKAGAELEWRGDSADESNPFAALRQLKKDG